ncbi:MAG: hypothetical protein IH939_17280 [Acidobacteria bacterium]|nr:hypothetical protein [Acidobacteriota bacterium]
MSGRACATNRRPNDTRGADRSQCRVLETPDRILERQLTIEMDDGSRRTFTAYRVQHSNVLGPYKGGVAFTPDSRSRPSPSWPR